MMMRQKVLTLSAAFGIALGGFGLAQAIAGGGPNSGKAGAVESQATANPTTGMPPTAQVAAWAVVRGSDGARIRHFRTSATRRIATGQYEVITPSTVRGCSYVATIGDIDDLGVEPPGEITVNARNGNANGVHITTHNSSGAFADRSFHVAVNC